MTQQIPMSPFESRSGCIVFCVQFHMLHFCILWFDKHHILWVPPPPPPLSFTFLLETFVKLCRIVLMTLSACYSYNTMDVIIYVTHYQKCVQCWINHNLKNSFLMICKYMHVPRQVCFVSGHLRNSEAALKLLFILMCHAWLTLHISLTLMCFDISIILHTYWLKTFVPFVTKNDRI